MVQRNNEKLQRAMDLYKKNDPGCIGIFESIGNSRSRSLLAAIYSEGRCRQPVNYDLALSYAEGNDDFIAQAVFAFIQVFIKDCDDRTAAYIFGSLSNCRKIKDDHPRVNEVVCLMLLSGRGTEADIQTAISINRKIKERKIFNRTLNRISALNRELILGNVRACGDEVLRCIAENYTFDPSSGSSGYSPVPKLSANYIDRDGPIELTLMKLDSYPPRTKLRAYDVLYYRYSNGEGVEVDYVEAEKYLMRGIGLCGELHLSPKYFKGNLAIMALKKQISDIDDRTAYEYLLPLHNVYPYSAFLCNCLIKGRGTDRDIQRAISIMLASSRKEMMVRLAELLLGGKGEDLSPDPGLAFELLSMLLNEYEPDKITISLFAKALRKKPDVLPEMRPSLLQSSKAMQLLSISDTISLKSAGGGDSIRFRYLDFSRRCGSPEAARREAEILSSSLWNKPEEAYSILVASGHDSNDLPVHIDEKHQILIDVDKDLSLI